MGIAYQRGEFVLDRLRSLRRATLGRTGRGGARRGGNPVVCAHRRPQGGDAGQRVRRQSGSFACTVAGAIRTSYVPEHALAPVKESLFLPYIFSHDEVRRIAGAAASHQGRFIWGADATRPDPGALLHRAAIGRGRAVAHGRRRSRPGTLMITASKGRSRILAIRADLVAELRAYMRRAATVAGRTPSTRSGDVLPVAMDAAPLTVTRHRMRSATAAAPARPQAAHAGASVPGRTSSAMPSPCIGSRPGRTTASTSTPSCRCCRPISATRTSSAPRSI